MARGHEIPIAAETGAFEKGIKSGVIEPLQDAEKELTKLGKNTGPDKLEDGLKDAQKASDQMASEIKRNASDIDRTFRKSDDDFELSNREKRKITRETIKEVGNEAKQNAAETFSSFDGSAQSFVDGIQGTLGGLVSSLGPVGIAAGAAGAAAIGLIQGAMQNADESSQAFKQDVADLTQALIDAGSKGVIPVDQVIKSLQKLATETDSGKVSLQKLFDTAKSSGNSFKDLAQAYAGNEAGLKKLLAVAKEKAKSDQAAADANRVSRADQDTATVGEIKHAGALRATAAAQADYVTYLQQASDKAKAAKKAQDEYLQAGGQELEIKSKLLDALAQDWDDVRSSAVDAATAEDGSFDVGKWQAEVEARGQAVLKLQDYYKQIKLSPEEWTNLLALPESAQAGILASYTSGSDQAKQRIRDDLSNGGKEAGSGAAVGFSQSFKPKVDAVKVDADTSKAKEKVADLTKGETAKVKVDVTGDKAAAATLDDLAKTRTAKVNTSVEAPDVAAAWRSAQSYWNSHPLNARVNYQDQYGRRI